MHVHAVTCVRCSQVLFFDAHNLTALGALDISDISIQVLGELPLPWGNTACAFQFPVAMHYDAADNVVWLL